MVEILCDTKPEGAGRNWLEVGCFKKDDFGDETWVPAACRYPQKDNRLTVKRKYEGRGASQKIRWLLQLPDDFPLTIVCRSGDARHSDEIVWTPTTKLQDAA